VSALNIDEIGSTSAATKRHELLDFIQKDIRCGDCLAPPQSILRKGVLIESLPLGLSSLVSEKDDRLKTGIL